ncbi:MAG: nuclease-related domain-containing protein [Planctomycetota bacterium]|nr:nuclease-related domain-containing protein [Planctomycetota bacterium]MDA1140198.1 nuclease-related domain-containing protein [Planctomycetota bacterium]
MENSEETPQPLRHPGQSLDPKIDQAFKTWTTHFIFTAGVMILYAVYEWARWIFTWNSHPMLFSGLAFLGIVFCLTSLDPISRRWRFLRKIRRDKIRASEDLSELTKQGYFMLHDFAPTEFRMDHVLIGPGGLYAVATESIKQARRRGEEIQYDGKNLYLRGKLFERDPISRARVMADWLDQKVFQALGRRFKIQPVVLFPRRHMEGPLTTSDVWVLNSAALPSYINLEEEKLNKYDLRKLINLMNQFLEKED